MRCVTQPTRLRAGIKKVVHINGAVIRANKKHGEDQPCITVQCIDGVFYGREVRFPAGTTLAQHFDQPRHNGAVVWLETRGVVEVMP